MIGHVVVQQFLADDRFCECRFFCIQFGREEFFAVKYIMYIWQRFFVYQYLRSDDERACSCKLVTFAMPFERRHIADDQVKKCGNVSAILGTYVAAGFEIAVYDYIYW